MSDVTEYFVRHYSLVIDNDQSTYHAATGAALDVVRDSDITRAEWLALSTEERNGRFAGEIGDRIGDLIEEWTEAALSDRDGAGALILREISAHNFSDVRWGLGEHFMPDDSDAADLLGDDSEGDDA